MRLTHLLFPLVARRWRGWAVKGERREADEPTTRGRILQITVYYKELLTINCQGTNHPRSILSFMDISPLRFGLARSLLPLMCSVLITLIHSLSGANGERNTVKRAQSVEREWMRCERNPTDRRWRGNGGWERSLVTQLVTLACSSFPYRSHLTHVTQHSRSHHRLGSSWNGVRRPDERSGNGWKGIWCEEGV